jgi:hypothetical protein
MEKIFKADGPRPDQKLSARRKRLKWGAALVAALLAVMPLPLTSHCYRIVQCEYYNGTTLLSLPRAYKMRALVEWSDRLPTLLYDADCLYGIPYQYGVGYVYQFEHSYENWSPDDYILVRRSVTMELFLVWDYTGAPYYLVTPNRVSSLHECLGNRDALLVIDSQIRNKPGRLAATSECAPIFS